MPTNFSLKQERSKEMNHVNYALGWIPILCGKSFAYLALPFFHPDAFLLPLAFSIFNTRSTSPAPQLIIWTIGRHPNRHVTTSAPWTVWKHEGQAVHMHCWVRALRIEMTHWQTHLGLFRMRGKTREAGDPLGEFCIPFRTLSLLMMYVITSTNQYSLVSPMHHITPPIKYTLTNKHETYPTERPHCNQVQPISM